MKWIHWLIIIALFIGVNLCFWLPAMKQKPPQVNYYMVTWDSDDTRQIRKQWRVVEILTSDLYKKGIISWEADGLLKELDKKHTVKYGRIE